METQCAKTNHFMMKKHRKSAKKKQNYEQFQKIFIVFKNGKTVFRKHMCKRIGKKCFEKIGVVAFP